MENFFLNYVKEEFDMGHLAYIYTGAIGSVLENELNLSPEEQIEELKQLQDDFKEALKLLDKMQNNIIFKNSIYKMLKISNNKYEIRDNNNKLVLKIEGNFTKDKLEEQFNNCTKNCIII